MWIQVRSFDGKKSVQLDNLSKLTKIEDIRSRLIDEFNAPVERQRLFYRGKQLVDGHTLFDYNVGLNDLVQILVRADLPQPAATKAEEVPAVNGYNSSGEESSYSDKENKKPETPKKEEKPSTSHKDLPSTYKIGDIIDGRDLSVGAWFEAKIIEIVPDSESTASGNEKCDKTVKPMEILDSTSVKSEENHNRMDIDNQNLASDSAKQDNSDVPSDDIKSDTENTKKKESVIDSVIDNDGFIYHVVFDGYDDTEPEKLTCKDIRPRAKTIIKFSDIKIGQKAMVNYNVDDPEIRGFWYDCIISGKRDTRTIKELTATMFIGPDLMPLDDCKLLFVDEVFEIEKPGSQINMEEVEKNPAVSPVKRTNKPECDYCKDNPRKKCKHCACSVCGGKHDPDKQILCDECDKAYHLACLNPPLETLPEEDEWYCPLCKNDDNSIVKAGEKLKESKKKSKMASAQGSTSRDWGRGMACVGRQKVCHVVPPNHFGPIPGVEVGTLWKFRVQVSEAGVHRPHVAGIHGRDSEGAYSIVLSGGYEDDKDNGNEFYYTGSGGRDLSGNKRTAEQSCDQKLTRMNRALAKNCNAPVSEKGATAENWKGGKPIRVVRNCKGRKHSDYAPEEGNRYDGIYKMVKYWPEKGKSGFIVWRYLMRRDDPIPAPWTKEGKKRTAQLGLEMQYPDGYLEALAKKEEENEEKAAQSGKKRKRQKEDSDSSPSGTPEKKQKVAAYKVSSELKKLIKDDKANEKLWGEALQLTKNGGKAFLQKVEELFLCVCCQDIVFNPITTDCNHNICKGCLARSIKAEVYSCPMCRADIGKDQKTAVNKVLREILLTLFPGYENGR